MKRSNAIGENTVMDTMPPQVVPGLDTSELRGGLSVTYDPNSDNIAQQSTSVNELIATRGPLHPGLIPGFKRLTHPVFNMEVLRPTQNASVVGDRHSPIAATGRVADMTITTNGSTVDRLAIFDGAFMPAVLGMEADVVSARSSGGFSSYYPLLYRHTKGEDEVVREVPTQRDIYYVCTEQGGDLRVRSIISGDEAHTQDAMIQRGIVHNDGTRSYDGGNFVDYLSYASTESAMSDGDINPKFEKLFKSFGDITRESDQYVLQCFVTALMTKIINPDYDYNKDGLPDKSKNLLEKLLPGILTGEYAASSATHPYLRGGRLLQELDLYSAANKQTLTSKGRKDLASQRSRILQSIVAAGAYTDIIGKSPKFDKESSDKRKHLNQNGIEVNTNIGSGLRFEALSLDEIDRFISLQARDTLTKMAIRKDETLGQKALSSIIKFLEARKDEKFVIRPLGGNKISAYDDLSPDGEPGDPSSGTLGYNGAGISHGVWGHYPFEIPRSLTNPYSKDKRFAEAGLAMGGVVAVFDVITPEYTNEKLGGPEKVRCFVFSGKQMPWCLQQALHARTHGQNRKIADLRDSIDGSFGIIEELERTRVQRWFAGRFTDNGVVMLPTPLYNGSAFAIARDRDGVLYEDIGKIPGQKPQTRSLTERRNSGDHEPAEPVYKNSVPVTNGLHSVGAGGALFETRFANSAVFVSGTDESPKLHIDVAVTPHFINAGPVKRKGR